MRVLVATLVKQLSGRMLDGLFAQDWPHPTEYLLITNDQPEGHPYERVTALYNQVRERFLAGPYDALLTVEADMLIPSFALRRLMATGADVAYGLYVWRHGPHHDWSAYVLGADGAMQSLYQADPSAATVAYEQGAVMDVAGVGLGCTLIKRHVLERLPFRRGDGTACNDWFFALDCRFVGYRQACDFGVVCGHITDWPAVPVLWPDPACTGGWRTEASQQVAVETAALYALVGAVGRGV